MAFARREGWIRLGIVFSLAWFLGVLIFAGVGYNTAQTDITNLDRSPDAEGWEIIGTQTLVINCGVGNRGGHCSLRFANLALLAFGPIALAWILVLVNARRLSTIVRQIMKINNLQLKIILGGAAIALAAVLYPPWQYTFQARGLSQVTKPAGYAFLFAPPAPEERVRFFGVDIDYGRLGIELLAIGLLTAGAIGMTRLDKSKDA